MSARGGFADGMQVEVWDMPNGRWMRAFVRHKRGGWFAESTKLTHEAVGTSWRHIVDAPPSPRNTK